LKLGDHRPWPLPTGGGHPGPGFSKEEVTTTKWDVLLCVSVDEEWPRSGETGAGEGGGEVGTC